MFLSAKKIVSRYLPESHFTVVIVSVFWVNMIGSKEVFFTELACWCMLSGSEGGVYWTLPLPPPTTHGTKQITTKSSTNRKQHFINVWKCMTTILHIHDLWLSNVVPSLLIYEPNSFFPTISDIGYTTLSILYEWSPVEHYSIITIDQNCWLVRYK